MYRVFIIGKPQSPSKWDFKGACDSANKISKRMTSFKDLNKEDP